MTHSRISLYTLGCGASCIYPLLGARINEWNFVASEIDDKSFEFAKKNVERNKLNEKIDVRKVDKEDILMAVVNDEHSFDFTMCNPPFFSDRWEASGESTRTERRPLPLSISTASEDESITQGGEVEFVKRIITESTVLKDKIRYGIVVNKVHLMKKHVWEHSSKLQLVSFQSYVFFSRSKR